MTKSLSYINTKSKQLYLLFGNFSHFFHDIATENLYITSLVCSLKLGQILVVLRKITLNLHTTYSALVVSSIPVLQIMQIMFKFS